MKNFDVMDEGVNAAAAYQLRSIRRKLERKQEVHNQVLSIVLFLVLILGAVAVAAFCSDSVADLAETEQATVQVQNGSYSYDEDGYAQYLEEKNAEEEAESARWAYLVNGGDHAD